MISEETIKQIEQKLKQEIEEALSNFEYYKLDIEINDNTIRVFITWGSVWREYLEEECEESCRDVDSRDLEYCVESCVSNRKWEYFVDYYYLPKLQVKYNDGVEVESETFIEDDIYSINYVTTVIIKNISLALISEIVRTIRKTIDALFELVS